MNKKKIQTMLNAEILNGMNDRGAASVLKSILFNPGNKINWIKAYELMLGYMPELKRYDGYKEENMR